MKAERLSGHVVAQLLSASWSGLGKQHPHGRRRYSAKHLLHSPDDVDPMHVRATDLQGTVCTEQSVPKSSACRLQYCIRESSEKESSEEALPSLPGRVRNETKWELPKIRGTFSCGPYKIRILLFRVQS